MFSTRFDLLILLIILLSGCYSRTPPIGEILIDTDQPALYQGTLPIGLTLDVERGAWDLLSPNLLVNGSFDLAPYLNNVKYSAEDSTITAPNGVRIFYPLPHHIYGWKRLYGNFQVVGGKAKNGIELQLTVKDSIAGLLHEGHKFLVKKGDRFRVQWDWRGSHNVVFTAQLVDDSLSPLSDIYAVSPTVSSSAGWQRTVGYIQVNEDSEQAMLLLRAERAKGAKDFYQDLEGNWHMSSSIMSIDNIRLESATEDRLHGVPRPFFHLLQDLHPAFLRYPNGHTANGFHPNSYPTYLDSLEQLPIWTLDGSEFTGDFRYDHFLSLAKSLGVPPILIVNFGFTDPTIQSSVEDRSKIGARAEYIAQIFKSTQDSVLIVQPGYGLSGNQYLHRFEYLEKQLLRDTLPYRLMVGGSFSEDGVLEEYVHDLALPDVEMPILHHYLPHPDSSAYSPLQTMIGQVVFKTIESTPYKIPSFVQKASFLIEAERYSSSLHGVTITPTLGAEIDEDLPIIYRRGIHYYPTELYHFLRSFSQMRGERIRTVSASPTDSSAPSLYLSLTSTIDDQIYYLKAVNTTRHPLPYTIRFSGLYSQFRSGKVVSFVLDDAKAEYQKRDLPLHISERILYYTLRPFEVALFQFNKEQ